MAKAFRICLRSTGSFVGMLLLLLSMVLSACAIPVLFFALFWLN